ncbi:DUF6415 family natural product biosynthesis protein [Streptomyces sp. Vc74B-19]|uniref:DUF6415 family natural product biosynthesis protein n=1 Tax=Streptomyces sp. Vc74B-19 TaxID=2741324 RepID=UPI0027E32721|nr:DUF6415 family natural product biosynthesis protein [Streptomyces sp. Vc74B-19]
MSAPTVARWAAPTAEILTALLDAVREWTPFDGGQVLEDLAVVLDDGQPPRDDMGVLAGRLRGHLARLVRIAEANEAEDDPEACRLLRQARALHAEALPGDERRAVGHLRQLAWSVNELLERLGALGCLRRYA